MIILANRHNNHTSGHLLSTHICVTEEEIDALGGRLAEETGGHIFHSKVDWSRPTPHMSLSQ